MAAAPTSSGKEASGWVGAAGAAAISGGEVANGEAAAATAT